MQAHKTPVQNTIKASEFKAKCLKLMDEVAQTGEELVITKNARPIARLVPYQIRPATLFGVDQDKLEILGDIISPLEEIWEAQLSDDEDPER